MSAGHLTILISVFTWLIMFAAFHLARFRKLHMSIMVTLLIYDLAIPVYLFTHRDWYKRLIENEDILTFGVWMHFMVVFLLYVLYVFQILAARRIMADSANGVARSEHRQQGVALLATRAFVIFTGALLYDPHFEL